MKRMPKYLPEIRVSAADVSRKERTKNDSHSECAMSDVATDCEILEANYSKRSKAIQGKNENREEDVILTDVDVSSDDERETVVRYPVDCINSILDLGMSCEEVSSSQGPNKRQKSITCSLERSKPRSLNADKFDDGGTDVEGVCMSEDEEDYVIDSDNEIRDFEPTAYVSISDKVVTGTIVSPRVTPDPFMGRKKRSSTLSAPIPISSVLTDTEMLISDSECNSTRSKRMNKVKTFKTMFDGFASDTEDSDSSTAHSSRAHCKPIRKISSSRSFENIRNPSSTKTNMLAPIRRVDDGVLTDTENIYLDDGVIKVAAKNFESRPSVIRMNKPIKSPEDQSTVRYRHNAVKSKPQPEPQVSMYSFKKCDERNQKQSGFNLNVPIKDDTGNATDIEAFGSDSDDQIETIRPVAYLPNPKCELIIDNESHKGKMSFILPITDSQKAKSLLVEDLDCGYSDVEDLPGFEAEDYFRYPTPDLPRTEHSTVQNKEVVIDPSKLTAKPACKEPLTDTEDLDLSQKPKLSNRLKVKLNHPRRNRDINECYTDIEDLDGSDMECRKIVMPMEDMDQVELTDVGGSSSDDSDDDDYAIYRFTAVTPDLEINNTYTNARESMSPFSFDVKRRFNEAIPKITTISPTPIPWNTSTEDYVASQEECPSSNWPSDDGHAEAHSSHVHIKHTRKFQIDQAEQLQIKGYVNRPDPTTDVEELNIFEALEELSQKKRKFQKSKEQSEGATVKVCYSGPKGPSCKPNTRIYNSPGQHDDKPRGADKSKEAVESSWLSQREGESVDGGMELNAGGLRSTYDNVNGIYYKEMADESVYPPQLGYAEFESPDILGSTSSLTQEQGTDTFSELLFSSSNSESEEPDDNFPISKEFETYGILYDMSNHINKVPEMFAKRAKAARVSAEARPDSPQDLESRLKYYHDLCNRSLSPEIKVVSPAERAELKELEESISQMLIDIRREESLFYSDNTEGATSTVKRRPKLKKDDIQDEKYKKMNEDGETALKEIESHISKLLQDVEKEEREVMGSLRREFRKSTEKLEESVPSPWDMINATTSNEGDSDVSYVRFRESSCTPSPVESSSTSEDEFEVVPRVELNVGSRLGRSTIDISVKNSPIPRRKSTRMSASKKSLNRSLPSLKSSSMSLVWKDHNSSDCLLESPAIWQSTSVEYISPPQRIEPGSGYCIWSYPFEDEYGQDQVREDVKKTTIQEKKSKESQKDAKAKDKGKGDDVKKEPIKKNDKPSLDRKDSVKRASPDKTPEPSKKVSPVKTDKKPLERRDSKKTPSPEKTVSVVKTRVTKVKSTEESTTAPTEKITVKSQKSPEKTDKSYSETDSSKLKSTDKTETESLKSESSVKERIAEKTEEKGKGKQKKGNNGQSGGMKEDKIKVEENISKQAVEPVRVTEKKSTILGKTIETIKKPFQDKGGDKTASKDEKGKGKGKGKGKQKSIDSIKSPSQESDVPVEVQEPKEDETKTETQSIKHETGEITDAGTLKTTKKPKFDKSIVEKSKETITHVLDEQNLSGQPDDKSKGKGEGKGIVPKPPTTISLSRTTSQEQEESIKDTKHGKSKLKDNGKGKDEESPKETKGKGKVKEKSQSPKTESVEKVDAKGEKPVSAQTDKPSEDKKNGGDKGTTKQGNGKGKGKGKVEQAKQQSADRLSVEEPLIEKAVHDISVITVGSLDKGVEEIAKKDDKESSKDDKNKGRGKDKIKDKSGPAKIPSFEESDKPLKPDTSVVGKAVEMIKKPFQDQTKPMDDTKTTQKAVKGKKQKSTESPKSPSIDKDYEAAKIHTELSSQSHSETKVEEKSTKPGSGEAEKKIEKVVVKDDKIKNEGKGKQKPIESNKSLSPEKDTRKIPQNEPTVESTSKEKIKDQTSPEPSKKEGKKKGKGKQKSIESLKKPSVENDEDNSRELSTSEPTLIEKTLETIKRPFQGKKDDKTASKQGQGAAGKKQDGKSKQKSIESASRQSSTEQEPKVETKITTETVRLIKELSQDKSGQVIEGQAIDLVTKPFGDKSSLLKSNDYASPVDESSKTATLIKELSQEKSGQQIEGKAIELVSKPFELKDIETLPSGGKVETTSTIVTLTKELSQEASSKIIGEKGIDIVSQPFQETLGAQKKMGDAPSPEKESSSSYIPIKELSLDRSGQVIGEKGIELVSKPLEQKHTKTIPSEETTTTKIISITKEFSQDKSGLVIEEEEIGIVSKPLQEMQSTTSVKEGTTIGEPLFTELSKEKSGFIIEERPIDLVSQPLQNMKETTLFSTTLPSADTKVLSKSQEVDEYSITGPLIEKLHQEKSGFIIEERPIDLVSQPFQDILLTAPHFSSGDMISESTKLIEKLSQDRSGQIIEGKPIDLVSGPLQGSLSKTLREEKTQVTGPLIEELSHKKSGFIIEERPIDLVSQPFQDILETSKSTELPPSRAEGNKSAVTKLEDSGRLSDSITTKSFVDTKKQPPSTLEGSARAVSLMTELSQDKSGQVIEEGAIDLVAQPFLGGLGRKEDAAKTKKKDSKTKAEEHKKRDESTSKKNDFEHIQKTIDDAKTQFDQFVGIVSDKAAKSSPGKTNDATNEKESTSTTTVTKITTRPFVIEERNILRSNDQEVEIPVEKEEDLLRIQKTIQHGFQNIPSGTAGAIDVNTVTTTTTTTTEPIQYEADKFSVDGIFSAIDKNVKKVSETVIESKDGAVTVIKTIESQVKPVKDASATLVEKTATVKGTLPRDSLLNFGEITNASTTQDDERKDPLHIQESIQQGAQNVQLEKVGKIDVKTITTAVTKPIEQGTGNIFMKAEEFVGAIDKNVMKASEAVEKSVDGGITVIGKTIESKVKTSKGAPASLVEKTQFTIQGTLPKDDWSTQVQQVLQNIPSENIGISDDAPIKPAVTKPVEQKAENISIQAEKIKDVIDKSVKKVTESVEKSFGTGESVIKQTIETQVKPLEDAPTILVEKSIVTVQQPLDDAIEKLGKLAYNTEVKMEQSQIITKGGVKDIGKTIEAVGLDAVGKVTNILNVQRSEHQHHSEPPESFLPELRAQSVKVATFETVETIFPTGTEDGKKPTMLSEVTGSSNDEIGRIIKEMESQLLSTKFGMDDSTVDEGSEVECEDYAKESRTMPTTPMPVRKMFGDIEAISDSEGGSKPYVTTPTLSRRVIGVGGSQRLTQDERPVVRVITEYVGDLSESEPEEDTYTVLEPEVKERRKFKIRFSPDMYGSEDKEEMEESHRPDSESLDTTIEPLEESDSKKSEKNIKRIERKFERMTSQTKEADPSMSELMDGEFQRMVSQLSLEEMDQALHQWDAGGLTPSEIDSKDLTLSSDDTTSPLQQGLTDIFRPKLSSILPTSIYVEKTGTEVGSSGLSESSKMKLSLVKDSVPQIFQSVETDCQVREGSHTLEPGETGETPPIPSPRTPLKPTDSQDKTQDQTLTLDKDEDESKNYATRKMFWEQMSSGSVETPLAVQDVTPPVPKPRVRSSISQSIDLPEEKKAVIHSEASIEQEVSEIGEIDKVLHGVTTTASVVRDSTTERGISLDADTNSEIEFIKSHDIEELSYDNDAFDDETIKDFPFPEPKQRKGLFERSVSLPGDTTIDISNNVRSKKRIFEAQIKKEMVVEQLMSQMEEEGSPEHKAFEMTTEPTDQAAMLNRQIHSEIVSNELEEQIESNLLENKALVQIKTEIEIQQTNELKQMAGKEASLVKTEDDASESDKTNDTSSELPSIYETKISSTVAEVLHYKNDAISKPSDSLEVHVDKSELEDTEKVKEIEEELRVIDEKYEFRQLTSTDQTKVSSITSSQGESEDTFSESDVTPEDVRFKEQQDIQVWGPSDKDIKLEGDKLDDHKKRRSIHTPEEHIPDTVWEVPVQESTEPLEVETVGQLPTAITSWQEDEALTESEARKIAEIFVGEIESDLINTEAMSLDALGNERDTSKVKTPERISSTNKSDNMLKLIRTDTTTSSMEITDEDLRSSGMTDNSPLESQVGQGPQMSGQQDVFGEDSGDDVDAQELDRDTIGKEVVEKTLAEVKQSLEAVKEELIEEKKKKRDSITKESPSEFEFKALVLEKSFTESIQEHHQEEATTIESRSLTKTSEESLSSRIEKTYSSFEQTSMYGSETKTTSQILTLDKTEKSKEPISQLRYDEISKKEELQFDEHKTSKSVDTTTFYTSTDHNVMKDQIVEPKEIKTPGSTTGSEVSIKSTRSQDTVIERDAIERQEPSALPSGESVTTGKVIVSEKINDELTSLIKTTAVITDTSSRPDLDQISDPPVDVEERKSPLDDVFSNSSSSDYKGGSNDASTLDKPNIIIRKHKKSTLGAKDLKSDGELYSSSGSHYESFEQTSDSIKSPGSRPLSSDIEGLVAAAAGMTTGSSEYESAVSHEISGQSTTITSRDYQTAVSSLSSRDSMKSLDSESSGNLASIEVSSEASETLVPSAMELEKDGDEPVIKQKNIPPFTVETNVKMQSFSESIEQSVSFDISGEDISEDDDENQVQPDQEQAIRMKRSHEMTFQPEPRPILQEGELSQGPDDKLASSLDDMSSLVSTTTDTGANRTVIELSKTESERMDGSATSEQLSLTVSGTSDLMSLSESREFEETTVLSRTETIATQSPPFQQSAGGVESVTITTSSIVEQGIQSVCTQVTSKVEKRDVSHSNGPTQVDYNAEYDEGDHEVKKRGHRRNGSTSFRPSMIPVFQTRETKKKSEDTVEDTAESDKYTQPLTAKEGTQEEKKDVDETERLEEEFYKTEADQAMNRDLREGRISIADTSYGEGAKSFDSNLGSKSRLHSAAFSDDHPDSEIAELLKQCSSDIPSEDPIERPKTPEPVEECELKDDTPEFSSEAQASVTELEMEYSGAFSRTAEYAAHVSPIREKGLPTHESWEHLSEGEQTMDDSMVNSPDPLHLGFEDSASEKHELETQESTSKEKPSDRSKYVSSPVPDITVTQHMHPTPQDSFENIEIEPSEVSKQTEVENIKSDVTDSIGTTCASKVISEDLDDRKGGDSASDSPTSDSFELLEKPDIADEFVIIEEVGREASEQDTEGKSVKIDMKRVTSRVGSSSAPTVVSPPTTVTKLTQVKYFSSGATEEEIPFDFDSGSPAKSAKSEKESSQEGSPPSAEDNNFKPDVEASKKWMEMQFQGAEPIAQIYGYDLDYERAPLEDIKEEDINDLEGSSRIGSMGSQVSQSIGSFGSVKESLSSTPDYDVLAGRKFFTRSGEHDDVSMSSLQEFERLEHLIAMESSKHKSLGSQDSLTSSSNNSRKQGSRSGGDDISLASLKEFEGLESACIAAERIETKAKAEEESLLSEIEEGHESQASESESCATISVGGMQRGESDEDDYERRMFEIDEIIRQAQTNVEQFMDSKNRETVEGGAKSETLGRADSLEEISKVPELDLDQPLYSVSYSSGKSYIQQWEDLGDDLITSTDSLELKTQKSKTSVIDPFTTSTDSLDVKISQDVMSVSTDSIEASQKAKKKDIMTDSIEVGEKTSMLTSVDSLEGKVTQANSIDEDEHHAMGIYDRSSSSGKEGDLSSSGKDDSAEGAVGMTNRMPPPRAEYLLGSTDSLEPTSSTATHATYQYETDSVMSSSFTSGDSATMVDDNDEEGAARASMWFDEGKPYVTEVIEPIIGDEEFSHVIHRKVEMPPEIHKVSFKGMEAEHALREYIEKFDPGEDCTETREVDEHGNVHVKRVIQKRVIVRPEELGGDTTDLSGPELEKYLQTLTQSQMETEPLIDTVHSSSESHSTVTTTLRTTTTLSQGDSIKTEQEQKQTVETHRRGSRPPLKYDISVDEEPEFDPREHDWRFNLHTHIERDEESQEGAYGFSESKLKGTKK